MFLEVVKAEYLNEYKIKLWFNNDVIKVVEAPSIILCK